MQLEAEEKLFRDAIALNKDFFDMRAPNSEEEAADIEGQLAISTVDNVPKAEEKKKKKKKRKKKKGVPKAELAQEPKTASAAKLQPGESDQALLQSIKSFLAKEQNDKDPIESYLAEERIKAALKERAEQNQAQAKPPVTEPKPVEEAKPQPVEPTPVVPSPEPKRKAAKKKETEMKPKGELSPKRERPETPKVPTQVS
jgi:hypothetical protein